MAGLKILVCGLPGSGKTTFAKNLAELIEQPTIILNADEIRTKFNDWDFSIDGRKRQADRMLFLANKIKTDGQIAIADFIAPLKESRVKFDADFAIWMDTITVGRFADTNAMFESLEFHEYDYKIMKFWGKQYAKKVKEILKIKFNV